MEKRKVKMMKVDQKLHNLLRKKSDELGVSMIDVTSLMGKMNFPESRFVVRKKKRTRNGNLFQLETDDEFLKVFK